MSVNSHLAGLGSNLVLADEEKSSISTSIATLQTRLDTYFGSGITDHFKFGSYVRGTILPRKADDNSDVDYMVVFSTSSESRKKPQTYLDRLKRFAENKYSTSEIHQSSPTVVLSLNHIKFELVPAVHEFGYQIPSPASSWTEWIYTDPTANDQDLQNKNKNHSYHIKPLVRLVKYWNAQNGHHFASFGLEQFVIGQFFSCSALKDFFYDFWSSFDCAWDTPQYIKDKVARAKGYARNAKEYEDNGMPVSAEIEIKKIVPEL